MTERRQFRPKVARTEVLAIDPKAWDLFFEVSKQDEAEIDDGIALVSICGPLEHHRSWWWDSYDEVTARVEASLKDEECRAVVLCIDSPGGDASGTVEAHRKIRKLRAKYDKPIFAYANETMCSAAYALGCAADEIWMPKTAHIGSIGVIATVVDRTAANKKAGVRVALITTGARKGDGDPNKPLTDDVEEAIQSHVDHLGEAFFKIVAQSRNMTPAKVAALEAGVFYGKDAKTVGIADGVSSWDAFMRYVRSAVGAPVTTEDDERRDSRLSDDEGQLTRSRAKDKSMSKTILQATKDRDAALKALESAETSKARKDAVAKLQAAERELARLEASKKKKYDEDEEEEDADEDAEDEEEEDADEDDDCEEDDEEEDEDEEDDEDDDDDSSSSGSSTSASERSNLKELEARSGLRTYHRLFRLCQRVTGEKSVSAVFGALDAFEQRMTAITKVEARLKKLEAKNRGERVDALLDRAMRDGKVTPGAAASLREQGMKDATWLKGHLKALPKTVRADDEAFLPKEGAGAPTLEMQGLSSDQAKMLKALADGSGKSLVEFAEDMGGRIKAKSNGAAPKS